MAVQIAFWLTLTFALIERFQPAADLLEWTVDQLPEAPVRRDVSLADTIAAVVMLLLTIGYLPFQHYQSWVHATDGDNIPILNPALWSLWLPALIGALLATVVFEIVKYRIGCWNWALFATKALLNLAFAVPLVWLALSGRLLNPMLTERLSWLADANNRTLLGTVIAMGAALVVVWDLIDTGLKTHGQAT